MVKSGILALFVALVGLCGPATAQNASFAAPSDNILCYLDPYASNTGDQLTPEKQPLVCLVFEANWTLPPYYGDDDPTCDLDRTRTIILPPQGPARARWTCHGDVFWPYPTPKIAYGSDWSVANHNCTMRTDGVRCHNASGNGFAVRRAKLELK